MGEPIRVLVAEDSVTVRQRIVEVLTSSGDITVVGEAADGRQAIDRCLALRPDVVTMDIMMPVVSGLEATEHIMAYCPTPIVVVSGSSNRGELFESYDALSAGALEVIDKPHADESLEAWERRLVDTVRIASRVRVITHPRGRLRRPGEQPPAPQHVEASAPGDGVRVVAIGASTGGPKAIVEILQALPAAYPVPILIATHISETFSRAFAEWLGANVPLPVTVAQHLEPLSAGVRVAPADRHLVVERGSIHLIGGPPRHSCRPSIDVLFESVARECGAQGLGILLTGMGADGAAGLLAIRRAGGITFAQTEASCVIFGMPAEAIRLGAAEHVLSPSAIGEFLRGVKPSAVSRR